MTPPRGRVALVTGANGISGNALIEHLIRQPKSEWARIIVTSRKPTKIFWQDDRVEHFSLDFLNPHGEIVAAMAPFCADVTHAFYASYVHTDDLKQLPVYNVPLFENFLKAVEEVAAASLQRICLQTGGKVRKLLLPRSMSKEVLILTNTALRRPHWPRTGTLQRRPTAIQ